MPHYKQTPLKSETIRSWALAWPRGLRLSSTRTSLKRLKGNPAIFLLRITSQKHPQHLQLPMSPQQHPSHHHLPPLRLGLCSSSYEDWEEFILFSVEKPKRAVVPWLPDHPHCLHQSSSAVWLGSQTARMLFWCHLIHQSYCTELAPDEHIMYSFSCTGPISNRAPWQRIGNEPN